MNGQELNDYLWQAIVARAGKPFETHKGVSFSYHIKEDRSGETSGVLMIDGKAKKITRSTVLLAYHRALELQEAHGCITKPGKIGVYGDTWLYPVFLDIGICTRTKEEVPRPLLPEQPGEAGHLQKAGSTIAGSQKAQLMEESVEEIAVTQAMEETSIGNDTEMNPQEAALVKTCSNCGYTTTEDFDFCPKCGRKFQ